jgi:MEDS: MEthanogen/methylotroph, DcmR Sensory domain
VFDRDLIAKILEDHSLSKRIEEFMPEDSRFPLSESFEFLLGLHPRSGLLREYTKDTIRKLTITGAASLGVHISATSTRPGGDLVDTLAAYFKAGLENKEFCLWLISPLVTEEVVRSALRQTLPEIDRYLLERGMEILPSDVWYREGGVFDLRRALNGWEEKLQQALARGYAGVRANGDATGLKKWDWRAFCEYERKLNNFVANRRMIVLCTYPVETSGAVEVLDVARTHELAVAVRNGNWELFEMQAPKSLCYRDRS